MKQNRILPVALIILILATLLSACGAANIAAHQPVTAAPTKTIAAVIATVGSTLTATPRPDAHDVAVAWTKAAVTFDAGEAPRVMIARICALASEYGCQSVQAWDTAFTGFYAKYPHALSQPVIESARVLFSGTMSDGQEYQVWEILGHHSNPPAGVGHEKFNRYPTFVWSPQRNRWEFFYSPDYPTAKSLATCGQFVEYAQDGHAYNTEVEWQAVYARCQTATPLAPTPFVPVTPVFTPKP